MTCYSIHQYFPNEPITSQLATFFRKNVVKTFPPNFTAKEKSHAEIQTAKEISNSKGRHDLTTQARVGTNTNTKSVDSHMEETSPHPETNVRAPSATGGRTRRNRDGSRARCQISRCGAGLVSSQRAATHSEPAKIPPPEPSRPPVPLGGRRGPVPFPPRLALTSSSPSDSSWAAGSERWSPGR